MKILDLQMRSLEIPFVERFCHAAAERNMTGAVLVTVTTGSGAVGVGEGCPRSYVTGEDVAGSLAFFEDHHHHWREIGELAELRQWVVDQRRLIDRHPAAWCAVEMALLDALAREAAVSVEGLLSLPPLVGPFRYTAVLGSSELPVFAAQCARYQQLGFEQYKVKLSGDGADVARLQHLNRGAEAGPGVRLDANNLWQDAATARDHLASLPGPFFAVEEPLQVGDYDGCRQLARSLELQIILDESCCRLAQVAELDGQNSPWIINLRVSKMGGLLRSLELAEAARRQQIPLVIGAQVGETSLLTRAALTVAQTVQSAVIGQEGAYGTHLLTEDITARPLMFGREGRLDATSVAALPGWGVELLPAWSG